MKSTRNTSALGDPWECVLGREVSRGRWIIDGAISVGTTGGVAEVDSPLAHLTHFLFAKS